jgi:hypothetical protein
MRVVVLDSEQVGTCLGILNTEWTRLDDRRANETAGMQARTIERQVHIEGIMALLRQSRIERRRTHGKNGDDPTA